MRTEWIEQSKHGLSYNVSDAGGELMIPICWKNPEAFIADLEQAAQAAFGMDLKSAFALDDQESTKKFHAAWLEVLKTKMRKESGYEEKY